LKNGEIIQPLWIFADWIHKSLDFVVKNVGNLLLFVTFFDTIVKKYTQGKTPCEKEVQTALT